MFNQFTRRTGSIPPVILNLLIINIILFFGSQVLSRSGIDLDRLLALYYPASDHFRPYQYLSHMFMHGSITHIFFNMFALWMFGRVLESVWGSKRFLIYYLVTGLGAAALHTLVLWLQMGNLATEAQAFINTPSPEVFAELVKDRFPDYQVRVGEFIGGWIKDPGNPGYVTEATNFIKEMVRMKIDIPTVGASGAVFGVLLAFGMLFPNTRLMLLFPPIPIKAKWFVIGYGVIELFAGVLNQPGDNIAHFAHLGGMIFGFLLIKFWNKNQRKNFY